MKTVCEMNSEEMQNLNNGGTENNNDRVIIENIDNAASTGGNFTYDAYVNFDFLFGKYFSRLSYFIDKNIADNFDDAINISQDAFLIFYNKVKNIKFESEKKAVSYLFQIARNLVQNHNRKGKFRKFIDSMVYFFETNAGFINKFEEAEIKTDFDTALSKIPQTYKETLLLKHIAELEISEIARVLDISVGTVKSRLFNGNIQLSKVLYEYKPKDNSKEGEHL